MAVNLYGNSSVLNFQVYSSSFSGSVGLWHERLVTDASSMSSGLVHNTDGTVSSVGRSFAEVVGERVIGPLVRAISSLTPSIFASGEKLCSAKDPCSIRFPSKAAIISCLKQADKTEHPEVHNKAAVEAMADFFADKTRLPLAVRIGVVDVLYKLNSGLPGCTSDMDMITSMKALSQLVDRCAPDSTQVSFTTALIDCAEMLPTSRINEPAKTAPPVKVKEPFERWQDTRTATFPNYLRLRDSLKADPRLQNLPEILKTAVLLRVLDAFEGSTVFASKIGKIVFDIVLDVGQTEVPYGYLLRNTPHYLTEILLRSLIDASDAKGKINPEDFFYDLGIRVPKYDWDN